MGGEPYGSISAIFGGCLSWSVGVVFVSFFGGDVEEDQKTSALFLRVPLIRL